MEDPLDTNSIMKWAQVIGQDRNIAVDRYVVETESNASIIYQPYR